MRTEIMGCPVDILTKTETLELAARSMQDRTPCLHVALNVAKLVKARSDSELDNDVRQADIIGIDGAGIALALRLIGGVSAPRYAGVDLFDDLMAVCAINGFRPYVLGAEEHVLETAVSRLVHRNPGLRFAGWHHGYFGNDVDAVIEDIRKAKPDCLFLAMPTPAKERFMARWRKEIDVPFVMGIGGTIDVVAGKVTRAPQIWQKTGFEWLYRVLQEPRRMWKRYLSTNSAFAWLLLKALLARPFGAAGTAKHTP
ncbi:MAG: WecB/TagA/CpsF family glycosyltransferase [Hyphomicrobiales bacterium]|nr:WecB/TagA/CpsF family glycosyltransferase [Hyphomicrobiales bacterium]